MNIMKNFKNSLKKLEPRQKKINLKEKQIRIL